MEPTFTSMKWELMMQLLMLSVPAPPFTHSKLTVLQCCPSHSGGELLQVLTAHSRYLRQRPLKFRPFDRDVCPGKPTADAQQGEHLAAKHDGDLAVEVRSSDLLP